MTNVEQAIFDLVKATYKTDRYARLSDPVAQARELAQDYIACRDLHPSACICVASIHESCTGNSVWYPCPSTTFDHKTRVFIGQP